MKLKLTASVGIQRAGETTIIVSRPPDAWFGGNAHGLAQRTRPEACHSGLRHVCTRCSPTGLVTWPLVRPSARHRSRTRCGLDTGATCWGKCLIGLLAAVVSLGSSSNDDSPGFRWGVCVPHNHVARCCVQTPTPSKRVNSHQRAGQEKFPQH